MPVAPDRKQITISDDQEIIARVDELVQKLRFSSRVELYEVAIRKFLKAPHQILAEILSDRAAEIAAKE